MNMRVLTARAALAGICCISLLSGCASSGQEADQNGAEYAGNADGQAEAEKEEAPGKITSLGVFSMQDLTGKEYTNEMFRDYDLTMINVFTTWCTPCVNEIPDLEVLHTQMADKGVNIAGVVLDAIGEDGEIDAQAVERARLLAERTGASYPFLIPDEGWLNGRLYGIEAVPETFFVDKDGKIVGDTYSGSHSFEEWEEIVEAQMDTLKGEQQ